MKKTVVFEFPDDFKFPEHFDSVYAGCPECPLFCRDDEGDEWCFLIGYTGPMNGACPFYSGKETINV